jgi:putative ABC transport system permease protein
VNLATLSMRNALRSRGRTVLTILGIAVAVILFTLMRTVVASWTGAQEFAAKDRIGTRHKVTFVMTLPKKYVEQIKAVPGVSQVNYANWFGGKDPNHPSDFFGKIAVDVATFLDVYPEIVVDPAQAEAWKQDRRGALVGDQLAKKFGWKVGQKVVMVGDIYPGDWEFIIDGIYTATSRAVDRSSMWFHWEYLNDSPVVRRKDQVGWIVSRIDDPTRSADISRQIDAMFDSQDTQTLTMSEKAMQQSFMGMFSAILTGINYISIAILLIILLILGNTIAMAVRERTGELGAMRAIGFQPRHIALLVAGEALVVGLLGGLVGLGLAYLFIDKAMGPMLEENMGAMFPFFRITGVVAAQAIGVAVLAAGLAAILPARRAARLDVVTALRTVE